MGTKGRPFYRIVAAPSSAGRGGRFVEQLGYYDPLKDPSLVNVDKDRVLHWLKNGASGSETLVRLLTKEGIWTEFESGVPAGKPRRKPVKPRVKRVKPVKEKKRKPKPEPEPVEAAAEEATGAEETPAVAEVVEETPAVAEVVEEAPAEAQATEEAPTEDTAEEAPEKAEE
jgi:small subunit ribosomal protein S16